MSYNVAICLPPISPKDDDAWAEINILIDEIGPISKEFIDLHRQLTSRYPCLSDLSDNEIDDGVWSDGPLINNFGHRAAVLGIVSSRVDEVLPFLITTANSMNMAVFDWATEQIHRP
jgi:hypothetical protein